MKGNIDLVNINAYTKFGVNTSVRSKGIRRKTKLKPAESRTRIYLSPQPPPEVTNKFVFMMGDFNRRT